ncbi:MAG TPA: hypothetical protein VGQ92_22450 [Actinoplanes sp.]|jgi:hypothetical protein|nr:hypothetical protein [Actinoplanes sp.]
MASMPTLIFEVGFTAGAGTSNYLHLDDPARGILDTNTLAPDDVLTDVTAYLHEVSTQRTSSRLAGPLVRYEAGQLSARLNNTDRRFDPTNLAGPYAAGGVTQVEPMRVVRLRATWAGVTYDVWRGFADAWLPGYEKGDLYADVSLTATDGFKVLAAYKRAAVGSVGSGENTSARMNRVLTSVAWPVPDRLVANGDTLVQATTLEGDGLTELQLVAETEAGEFYIDQAGRAFFRGRHGLLEEARSNTSQATFGDAGAELPYFDIVPAYDEEQIFNNIRVTRAGGAEQVATDAASVAKYLTHTYTPSSELFMQSDPDALNYAQYVLAQAKSAEYRFDALVINPATDPANLFPQVLGRRLGDRITVRRRPPGGGLIERDVFIVGVSHDATPDSWLTTWQLQAATKTAYLILDHPTLGQLDNNALAY